ncbi:MAG: Hsp70 family protein [Chitinivibrionales bacterium]|nr:Hsp70 family protein [Chitinivibrionales bacterium]
MEYQHALGIDFGTSNCAMALALPDTIEIVDIPQLDEANRIGEHRLFASALYIPQEGQFAEESLRLPWSSTDEPYVLGNFARAIGAQVPERLVTSTKSWLCQPGTDPTRPLLPWGSTAVPKKLSAIETSRHLLQHLRAAYQMISQSRESEPDLSTTRIVLTVPASFDEVARRLTQQAAIEAGWGDDVVLVEEPQAAFYSWLNSMGSEWRDQVSPGDVVLVCDTGGGTTDFSLIAVSERQGNLELERISVGRHILLGGDNMDLALAFALRHQLEEEGKSIDDHQLRALVHASRAAKEQLFENEELENVPVAVAGTGGGLFAGAVSTRLTRAMLNDIVVDGFFAATPITEMPQEAQRGGLKELGLSYAADPVISRHLAAFLTRSRDNARSNKSLAQLVSVRDPGRLEGAALFPDAILFNGGVFRAAPLRERVLQLLHGWMPDKPARELTGTDLDLAVARGAASYGRFLVSGEGVRIRAGVARSYYVGLESTMPAVPGYVPPVKAICVAEQGMEEGDERVLQDQEFGLVTGATVHFRFFSSAERAGDSVGGIVANAEKQLEETTSLEMTLDQVTGFEDHQTIPVRLHSRLNELGVLQLWMQNEPTGNRWELSFSVRTE